MNVVEMEKWKVGSNATVAPSRSAITTHAVTASVPGLLEVTVMQKPAAQTAHTPSPGCSADPSRVYVTFLSTAVG